MDAGLIDTSESGAKNQVYGSSNTNILSVTGEVVQGQQDVGVVVCRHGLTSDQDCGTITGTTLTITYADGRTIQHLWRINIGSAIGDSGGSIIKFVDAGPSIGGSLSATTQTEGYYSPMTWIKSILGNGLRPCLNGNCS